MSQNVIDLNCPGCGARVNSIDKECRYCGGIIIVSSFNSIASMLLPQLNKYVSSYKKTIESNPDEPEINFSLGACYLKLKLYDKAIESFEKSIDNNIENAEAYFYSAVCLLKGKKAFLADRLTIDRIEELINVSLAVEPRGVFYYFWSYIKYDYYNRKYFNTTPNFQALLQMSVENGVSEYDKEQLFELLLVPRPTAL
jgi:tetratricopeptide (TPR) repeat protein